MTPQPQTRPALRLRRGQGIGLIFVLALALFGALLMSLAPVGSEPKKVQAAEMQVKRLRAAQAVNTQEFICLDDGKVVITSTQINTDCENYTNPPAIGLDEHGVVFADNHDFIQSVVLADVDGDGDLDIATTSDDSDVRFYDDIKLAKLSGFISTAIKVYTNQAGHLLLTDTGLITESKNYLDIAQELAWGDVDNDGDLDLATANVGDDKLYIMENGWVSTTITLLDIDLGSIDDGDNEHGLHLKRTNSVAWGDMNGDGRLELALGNYGRMPLNGHANVNGTIRIYTFRSGNGGNPITPELRVTPTLPFSSPTWVTDLQWSDYDSDGDLDLIAGLAVSESVTTRSVQVQVYKNQFIPTNGVIDTDPIAITESHVVAQKVASRTNEIMVVAPADIDSNGTVDLAVRSDRYNIGILYDKISVKGCLASVFTATNLITSTELHSLAWGDVDGDGDLDLAAGFQGAPNRIHLNQKGCINHNPVWESEFDPVIDSDNTNNGTRSLAWGDMDNDGDLDLVAGGFPIGQIYYNNALSFQRTELPVPVRMSREGMSDLPLGYVTLGDVDNDGDLDIARHIYSQPVEILVNHDNAFSSALTLPISAANPITSYVKLHWGDINRDSFLDLVVTGQYTKDANLYLNDHGTSFIDEPNETLRAIFLVDGSSLGDIDHDQQVELLRSYGYGLYRYNLAAKQVITTQTSNRPSLIELGDLDNDGDLDIAATNQPANSQIANEIHIYKNQSEQDGASISKAPTTIIKAGAQLRGLAWGDMNGDGYLDLAVAVNGFEQVYFNQAGVLSQNPIWQSTEHDNTWRLAWADVDGDGDLDLATASTKGRTIGSQTIYRVYRNAGSILSPGPAWVSAPVFDSTSLAWGDLDNDGTLELVTPTAYYTLNRPAQLPLTKGYPVGVDPRVAVAIDRFSNPISATSTITALAIANFHAMPFVREQQTLPITFTLYHPLSQNFDEVRIFYSLNGGGQWNAAVDTNGSNRLRGLASAPYPKRTATNTHSFGWDVLQSNIFGQYEAVMLRIEAYATLPFTGTTSFYTNSVPALATVPSVASQTYPFRLRGSQVRVIDENGNGVKDAIVYRIPAGQSANGTPLGQQGIPYRTDAQGYLQGRGTIAIGDQLLALAPQPLPTSTQMQWAEGLADTIHLYHTNGKPTELGTEAWISNTQSLTVTQLGTQILQVSKDNPLLLFDLNIAVEWDASTDPNEVYLSQLRSDLRKAAEFLYDFTNGQVTLGKLTVTQDAEDWMFADVFIKATNRLRPLAVQGGVVITPTPDIDRSLGITYTPGQVIMGSTWSRYGAAGQNLGYDWPLALAHELSHYLFFLDDTYIGKTANDLLIPVDSCQGSVMGDMYNPSGENTEFISDAAHWNDACAKTLAHELGRTEWETILQRYPMLTDTNPLEGPSQLPFNLTQIDVLAPTTPTNALPDPIIFLDYGDTGRVSSPSTRAFLIRDDAILFDLGTAIGGQNRLLARGAQPGDTLCVFDPQEQYSTCSEVSSTSERIRLQRNSSWTPQIEIHPINTTTLNIQVSGLPTTTKVAMRIFPNLGNATLPRPLVAENGIFSTTTSITYLTTISDTTEVLTIPVASGHLELWEGDPITPTDELSRTIVAFAVGGNFGNDPTLWAVGPYFRIGGPYFRIGGPYFRIGGPYFRIGGPYFRIGGPFYRGSNAPVASTDGQLIVFTKPEMLQTGDLYSVQSVNTYPRLPENTKAVGLIYSVITSKSALTGSVSFQYLGIDALSLGLTEQNEQGLTIWYLAKGTSSWNPLSTTVNTTYNLASASIPSNPASGLYALVAKVRTPSLASIMTSTNTITITGKNFDSSLEVLWIDRDGVSRYVPAIALSPTELSVTLSQTQISRDDRLLVIKDGQISGTCKLLPSTDHQANTTLPCK